MWATRLGRGRRGLAGNRWLARRPSAERGTLVSVPRARGLHVSIAGLANVMTVGPARARASRAPSPGGHVRSSRDPARVGFKGMTWRQ